MHRKSTELLGISDDTTDVSYLDASNDSKHTDIDNSVYDEIMTKSMTENYEALMQQTEDITKDANDEIQRLSNKLSGKITVEITRVSVAHLTVS